MTPRTFCGIFIQSDRNLLWIFQKNVVCKYKRKFMSLLSLAQLYFFNFKSKFFCIAVTKPKGYKMVPQKNVGLRKFWPNLEILEANYCDRSQSRVFRWFCVLESQIFSVSVLNCDTWVSQYRSQFISNLPFYSNEYP